MKRLYIIFHVNNFLLTHVYPFLIMNMALIMVSYSFSLTFNLTVIFCFKADILSHLHFFFLCSYFIIPSAEIDPNVHCYFNIKNPLICAVTNMPVNKQMVFFVPFFIKISLQGSTLMSSMYPCFAEAQQLFSLPDGTFWYEGFILLIVNY